SGIMSALSTLDSVEAIDAKIRDVEAAHLPVDEVMQVLTAEIDAWASEAKPRVTFGKHPSIALPVIRINAAPSGPEIHHTFNNRAFLARFHKEEILAYVRAQVAKKYESVTL